MGYDAEWCVVSAADLGAPHKRDRIWLLARRSDTNLAHSSGQHGQRLLPQSTHPQIGSRPLQRSPRSCSDGPTRWPSEPDMGRVAYGVAFRMDRLKALGNGQVPRVAATAFHGLHTGQW
ncbi:DNA cytosine methyltransferase [Pseudomonas donghuensis]|nr:DNA cytosine methyltransferase [Pseudomonas donghuensis]